MLNKGKNILTVFVVALVMLGLGSIVPTSAYASSSEVQLTFSQNLELNGLSSADDFMTQSYVLEAVEPNTPMPEGATDNMYAFSMTGNTDSSVAISFDRAGVYKYRAYQSAIKGAPAGLTGSSNVYDIEVYVQPPYETKLIVKLNDKKTDVINWKTVYVAPPVKPSIFNKLLSKTGDVLAMVVPVAVALAIIGTLFVVLGFKRRNSKES